MLLHCLPFPVSKNLAVLASLKLLITCLEYNAWRYIDRSSVKIPFWSSPQDRHAGDPGQVPVDLLRAFPGEADGRLEGRSASGHVKKDRDRSDAITCRTLPFGSLACVHLDLVLGFPEENNIGVRVAI
jgi:hypothetical protein